MARPWTICATISASCRGTLAALDLEAVESCRRQIAAARDRGSRIFLCGNGGSAATASHMANDLGKGASLGRPRQQRFRVTALTDNVPWMTALANDLDYDSIFAEQLRNLGEADDLLIAISGSGNSANVLNAVAAARELGDADDRLDRVRGEAGLPRPPTWPSSSTVTTWAASRISTPC